MKFLKNLKTMEINKSDPPPYYQQPSSNNVSSEATFHNTPEPSVEIQVPPVPSAPAQEPDNWKLNQWLNSNLVGDALLCTIIVFVNTIIVSSKNFYPASVPGKLDQFKHLNFSC